MEWLEKLSELTWEDITAILDKYEALGPLPGILAPFIESFLPFLPLIAIVIANAEAYGLWKGFILSWIGVSSGCIVVFAIVRTIGNRIRHRIERRIPRTGKIIHWIENKGFTLIFMLHCFPFTPSFLVNVVSGLSRLPVHTYVTATILGKGLMLLLVSYAGYDLASLFRKPLKLVLIVVIFTALWYLGRKLESRYLK